MKIVCATNMPLVREAFATLGDVVIKGGRDIARDDVQDAELLVIRSTTKVGRELLDGTAVRFVGTATIGTDHLDIPYLEQRGIHWCHAPGCNANSVAEYIATALLCLAQRHHLPLAGKTLGVIGVGNVGSRVVAKARALGMRVLLNDPPLERQTWNPDPAAESEMSGACLLSQFPVARSELLSLNTVLEAADVVTLHVPLTAAGPDATRGLANEAFFGRMKPGAIFINSARGPVMQTDALLRALASGHVAQAVIDTWEGEPGYRHDLLPQAALATPHIAGYSYDGRVNGTVMVYRDACRFLGVPPTWSPEGLLPPAPVPEIDIDLTSTQPGEAALYAICRRVYDIETDDRRMRETALDDRALRAAAFDRLRKTYPERREFHHTRVTLRGPGRPALASALAGLGFAAA